MTQALRVVSLVPSLTELVYFLEPKALVGRTKFCVYPTEIIVLPTVGGTKNVDVGKVRALRPNLIMAAREENIREQVELLACDYQVLVLDIRSVEDALSAILEIGRALNQISKATDLVLRINRSKANYRRPNYGSAIYLIWQKPWMTVGGDTYISAMLMEAGFSNLYVMQNRYPTIGSTDEFCQLSPDYLLLSSEPYPFSDADLVWFKELLPSTKVVLVDGTFFSWYGCRLNGFYEYVGHHFKTVN